MICVLTLVVTACAPSSPTAPASAPGTDQSASAAQSNPAPSQPGRRKVLNMGLRTIVDGFSIAASSTTSGGGLAYIEIHSQALFTADKTTGRPIPRLLTEQPTLENGGLRLTNDGRMVATYK